MTKKGLFFCALNLPLVTAGCAVVFQTSRQLVQLVAAMACLKAFTQLNFGFTRTLWYAPAECMPLKLGGAGESGVNLGREVPKCGFPRAEPVHAPAFTPAPAGFAPQLFSAYTCTVQSRI